MSHSGVYGTIDLCGRLIMRMCSLKTCLVQDAGFQRSTAAISTLQVLQVQFMPTMATEMQFWSTF